MPPASPAPDSIDRFRADLEALTGKPPALLGIAVSGGPDSVALLLLASTAYPGVVRAATVDHGLRPEAAAEAAFVADLCAGLGVPHRTLTLPPEQAIAGGSKQAKAREARYRLLCAWLAELGGSWLATAHHLDDQAETVLMRLGRGAGAGGLSGIRRKRRLGASAWAIRPLLGWRKAELVAIVHAAGIEPVDDPSNRSPDYDRTAARALLAATPALDPLRLAASGSHLAEAQEALEWAAEREWDLRTKPGRRTLDLETAALPRELLRRLVIRAIDECRLAAGIAGEWRRDKLGAALDRLKSANRLTLAEVQISRTGSSWRFERAPRRGG